LAILIPVSEKADEVVNKLVKKSPWNWVLITIPGMANNKVPKTTIIK
jgi:hypothetical protein